MLLALSWDLHACPFVQVFSEGQLMHMDWNNVVAAGGSVLAAIHPPPPGPLRDFYHTLAYR